MSRKNRSPEEKARRAKIRELLQMANIDSMDDMQKLLSLGLFTAYPSRISTSICRNSALGLTVET